jgi:glycine betaine/proline transport system substrate-binding protein
MWEAIASGDKDGMVAGWLPSLQSRYLEKHRQEVVDLGPNLEGTKIGLVVPGYVSIESIGELREHGESFDHKIIGIDPHAGLMETTETAMEAYGLSDYSLVSGSGPTMTTALGNAIEEDRWIVVTGWTPHWKFARWDLKYLEDPENVYGGEERIHTVVRRGLKAEMPEVYSFLDSFYWEPAHMQQVMLMARDPETSYGEAARRWVKENEELVDSWLDGQE